MFESIIFKYLATFLISMTPIIELRGAIPIAVLTFHLTYVEAFVISLIGPLFDFFGRFKIFKVIIDWASDRATKKIAESKRLQNFTALGLFIFVAIPLPGTGAWVGSLIANFLDLPLKKAFWPLALGVLTAGIIMLTGTALANGGIQILLQHV